MATVFAVSVFLYILNDDTPVPIVMDDSKESAEYLVTHIVDGDTFDIATGERVRMIGIDTPERGKSYYDESAEYLKDLIYDKKVRLEKDQSEIDRYGRLLRHVYVNDVWINHKMISDGYARFVTFPPDVEHAEVFRAAQKEAREAKKGLWADHDLTQ